MCLDALSLDGGTVSRIGYECLPARYSMYSLFTMLHLRMFQS